MYIIPGPETTQFLFLFSVEGGGGWGERIAQKENKTKRGMPCFKGANASDACRTTAAASARVSEAKHAYTPRTR